MFKSESNRVVQNSTQVMIRMQWIPPAKGWLKLNTDAAVHTRTNAACIGGVLRDCRGRWIRGFTKNIGICQIFSAEAMGILEGLGIAWRLGVRQLVVENDNEKLMMLLQNGQQHKLMDPVIARIKLLLNRPWNVQLRFSRRNSNGVADALAKLQPRELDTLLCFDHPPDKITPLFIADRDYAASNSG